MSLINDALKRAKQTQQRRAALHESLGSEQPVIDLQPADPAGTTRAPKTSKALIITPLVLALIGLAGVLTWHRGRDVERVAARTSSANPAPVTARSNSKDAPEVRPEPSSLAADRQENATPHEPANPAALPVVTEAEPNARNDSELAATATPALAEPREPEKVMEVASVSTTSITPEPRTPEPEPPPAPSRDREIRPALKPAAAPPVAVVESQPPPVTPPSVVPASDVPAPEFKIQGIFYRLKNPTALVNGRILAVGDTIDGYRVDRIERHTVRFTVPGRTNTVTLY